MFSASMLLVIGACYWLPIKASVESGAVCDELLDRSNGKLV